MPRDSFATRKSTSISIDVELVSEARRLGINISRACENAISQRITERKRALWLEENAAAIADANAYVEANGLPLARHRRF